MRDVHYVPFRGRYLIYRPLRRLAFIGNRALVTYLRGRAEAPDATPPRPDIEEFLDRTRFREPGCPPLEDAGPPASRPAVAVLLMTNRCNLACTYCYAAAGSQPPADMPWPIAKAVIDAAAANALANGDPRFGLSFHGGGEPTLNWRVLTAAVEHARSQSLPCDISLASNGVWPERTRDFVCRNINSVTLSFDGVQAAQDTQRPRRGHGGSFETVMSSIRALDAAGVPYGIRMTVTPATMERLPEGVLLLCNETGARAVQIEASFTAERGVYADPPADICEAFARAFLKAVAIASERNVFVSYSGARPWLIAHAFCLAPAKALIATPQGRLVACFEATGDGHPYTDEFTIGRVTPDGIQHDAAAYRRFLQRQEGRRSACGDCFCYWHCCGDCASRAMVSPAPDSMRCKINREITMGLISAYVARGGGLWMGGDVSPVLPDPSTT